MSTTFHMLVLCLLLLLSSIDTNMAARNIPSSAPSTIVRPLTVSEAQDYVSLKPMFNHKHRVFRGTEVKNCLPKGFRHSSAPSRFVNFHTLGSTGCFSTKRPRKPWCMLHGREFKKYGRRWCVYMFLVFMGVWVMNF